MIAYIEKHGFKIYSYQHIVSIFVVIYCHITCCFEIINKHIIIYVYYNLQSIYIIYISYILIFGIDILLLYMKIILHHFYWMCFFVISKFVFNEL